MSTAHHDWFDSTPIVSRKAIHWPNGARLAVAFVVSIEQYEMVQAPGAFIPATLPGGMGRGPYPDFRSYSLREYGNRIGVFRVMEALDRHGLKATAAIDASVAMNKPIIASECVRRGWEIAAHGNAVTQMLTSKLDEAQERAQISGALKAIEK